MTEYLFGVSLRASSVLRQGCTDTVASPALPIPVYFIHSFEQPFCHRATCPCHTCQQEVVKLFVSIIEGQVELEPAAALLVADGREPQP